MSDPSDALPPKTVSKPGAMPSPHNWRSPESKARFAVAKYYGMGSDGEWTVAEIAEALDLSERQVYNYLKESQIAKETREILAHNEAEWRLDLALQLRREVQRLEEIERELLQQKQAVATGYDIKTVEGTPTGDRNIKLPDNPQPYRLEMPVPTDFEVVTDYGPDLERVQKEKRQYLSQIAKLLGLNEADKKEVDHTLATRHEEVKIVEYRGADDDDYPEAEIIDVDGEAAEIEATEATDDAEREETDATE